MEIDGFDCYPSDEPKVVMLATTIDLEPIRQKLRTVITHEEVGGEIKYPAHEPHITLFKGGDGPADGWSLENEKAVRIHTRLTELDKESEVCTHWIDNNINIQVERK